ncbi:MAG: TIM-barrel domain-containing protein [Ferruginibacter sp.]
MEKRKQINIRILFLALVIASTSNAQKIIVAGQPAQLDIRSAGEQSIRITLKPLSFKENFPFTPAVVERIYPAPAIHLREISKPVKKKVGNLNVEVLSSPLTVIVTNTKGQAVQTLIFTDDGNLSFKLSGDPVLGMGEGGPKPLRGVNWRNETVQFDRRGKLDSMQPRWQSDAYGSRNPVAMLIGTEGWGLFVSTPWTYVDLRENDKGVFIPWKPNGQVAPQSEKNQQLNQGKGIHPVDKIVPGLYDLFVFDAHDPQKFMKDFSVITGPAAMPPKWALGYMQSHRTLEDETQMLGVIDSFRTKKIPVDAVIYLGTGFTPRGWNKPQPSFEFNPEVFKRNPKNVLADMHARNVKVIVHMVPFDRNKLPILHGNIPPKRGEKLDAGHIQNYWQQHVGLIKSGIDAFWPDEGDWFDLFERIRRHQLYYQGHLFTNPNIRPWSLQRNGYPGIAQWGGWVWSGDTESSWKTLEAQIAAGINYCLSIGPYWGSDIGGFYPNEELTGELYARWFQFGAFCGSFRSHGRTWWTRLPWGWGLNDLGPLEGDRYPLKSELNNSAIEPEVKKYDELRYQLMPYTYTLAWQARNTGMPLMRAMWLHYPNDEKAKGMGTQYLWGPDLLIAPVFKKGATSHDVYLPKGDWYDWWTNKKENGGQTITRVVDLSIMPIYVRAGAILPVDPVRQFTSEIVNEPTTLKIYSGADGKFILYEDDGISQDYLKGKGTWTNITWNDQEKKLSIEPGGAPKNATNTAVQKKFKVELIPNGSAKLVSYKSKLVTVQF